MNNLIFVPMNVTKLLPQAERVIASNVFIFLDSSLVY